MTNKQGTEKCNHWTCNGCDECGGWANNPDSEQSCSKMNCDCHDKCDCYKECDGECNFQEPYGFVPHAGCPLHDSMTEDERKQYTKDRYVPTEEKHCAGCGTCLDSGVTSGEECVSKRDCACHFYPSEERTVTSDYTIKLVPTTDQEVKCCHHKDSAQTCIQYAKEAFEKGQQFSVSEAVKKERETLLKGIVALRKPENGEEIDYTVAQEFNLEYNSALTDVANIIRSREQ